MKATIDFEFKQSPGMAPTYLRALLPKEEAYPKELAAIPIFQGLCNGLKAEKAALELYRKACGYANSGNLPIGFPHIMASPLFMSALTDARFPYKTLGMVHVKNLIQVHVPIPDKAVLDFHFTVADFRDVKRGVEFEVRTAALMDGKEAWQEVCTFLAMTKPRGEKRASPVSAKTAKLAGFDYSTWELPENLGRAYARSSGDFNPIHLHALSAKLFGFPRAIIHGMWLMAKTDAVLAQGKAPGPAELSIEFRSPVFLPGKINFAQKANSEKTEFEIQNKDYKAHARGYWSAQRS